MKSGFPVSVFYSILLSILCGCPLDPFADDGQLVIMSYNTQNLFDDVSQGLEYPEYDPENGDWTTDSYLGKLAALGAVVKKSPKTPDIILLQEVENLKVIKALAEDFLASSGYGFFAAPPADGAAVQTAVISRRRVISLITHKPGSGERERNILEIRVALDDGELVIFNNHWKSRLGGAVATEEARCRAALCLARRLRELEQTEPETPFILAGDFNEDPWEPGRDYPVALGVNSAENSPVLPVPSMEEGSSTPELIAGGFWNIAEGKGSYWYSGSWERIDSFFWSHQLQDCRGWEVSEAVLVDDPLLLNSYGSPLAYNGETLLGYSDHLPLVLLLKKL